MSPSYPLGPPRVCVDAPGPCYASVMCSNARAGASSAQKAPVGKSGAEAIVGAAQTRPCTAIPAAAMALPSASRIPAATPSAAAVAIEALADEMKAAPRYGMNAKALILQVWTLMDKVSWSCAMKASRVKKWIIGLQAAAAVAAVAGPQEESHGGPPESFIPVRSTHAASTSTVGGELGRRDK